MRLARTARPRQPGGRWIAVALAAAAVALAVVSSHYGVALMPGRTTPLIGKRDVASSPAEPAVAAGPAFRPGQVPAASSAATGAAGAVAPAADLPPIERMVAKTGELVVQVADLAAALDRVNGIVAAVPGAYVAGSNASYQVDLPALVPAPETKASATVVIKVPSDAFGDVVARLRQIGRPLRDSISSQEVTEEYVDLTAQVRNLEATEQQYIQLLDRAQKIEEILPIQQRLTEVRSQIDRLRGRMNLLQRRADMSTITLSLTLPGADGRLGEPRPVRTLRYALASLEIVLQQILDLAIYLLVYAIPVMPLLALLWWWRTRRPSAGGPATAP